MIFIKKKDAINGFNYYGNNIYSPTGRKSEYNEKMRSAWAKAIDSGYYRKLPEDATEADKLVKQKYSYLFKKKKPFRSTMMLKHRHHALKQEIKFPGLSKKGSWKNYGKRVKKNGKKEKI